ncbi:hypothetical protein PIB30_071691 [Stylosanthes scabra]|uniref:Uncharacterized protein n=1 Tax=Stylosanthes scabra TaxID=79078 RepID=A0ABU6SP00_9FABA|nr:hypothetical protein [Stylosanthes scabra]
MALRTYHEDTSLNILEDIIISLSQRGYVRTSEPFAELAPPRQYLFIWFGMEVVEGTVGVSGGCNGDMAGRTTRGWQRAEGEDGRGGIA